MIVCGTQFCVEKRRELKHQNTIKCRARKTTIVEEIITNLISVFGRFKNLGNFLSINERINFHFLKFFQSFGQKQHVFVCKDQFV